ncbi:MAG: energy-coupling factor ABC transporter ATP-binding protein [Magnetococcus sp. MYC-9]
MLDSVSTGECTEPLLLLDRLSWRGGGGPSALLRDLSWPFGSGERWAITGPEGCGKTTLLRLMAGLLRPDSGDVRLQGQPCATHRARATLLGVLFAEPAAHFLSPVVWEEVALTPAAQGLAGEEVRQRVQEALCWAGVPEGLARRELASLSAAQAARVAWAALLVMRPRLLLLDEPGAHLSSEGEQTMATQLLHLQPMTSITFTSRLTRARRFADRILVLEEGVLRLL